jgi:hypothetical protein
MSKDGDEKKATEELLSGFDRPGRTPRAPRVKSRDFVDYYSGRSAPAPDAPPKAKAQPEETGSHEKPTVIIPRRRDVRTAMTWVVAVVGMILFGVTIAVLATPPVPQSVPLPPVASPLVAPTSATTITSANPQPAETVATAEPDPIVAAPQMQPKKAAPSATITSGASSVPTIKTAPRDDFIRDM